jgi:hypothetical protein
MVHYGAVAAAWTAAHRAMLCPLRNSTWSEERLHLGGDHSVRQHQIFAAFLALAKPLGQCHRGQPSLPIAVDSHIDDVGDSLNDGITSRRA